MDKDIINPWKSIPNLSKQRVDAEVRIAECSWFVDNDARYGFLVEVPKKIVDENIAFSLKGIDAKIRHQGNISLFMLVLSNKDEWEIFYALCMDLISASNQINNVKSFFTALQNRLKRWQSLLSQKGSRGMKNSVQMGLFTELTFMINHLIPKFGIEQSIEFWVGPESDKQDFLLEGAVIEIKSHRTTKSANISISSPEQLVSIKEPLYLVAYSLSSADSGKSIADLIAEIESNFTQKQTLAIHAFHAKLDDYGFIPATPGQELMKFINDREAYYSVTDKFPKIQLKDIPDGIFRMKFSVDLNKCEKFRIENLEEIL